MHFAIMNQVGKITFTYYRCGRNVCAN